MFAADLASLGGYAAQKAKNDSGGSRVRSQNARLLKLTLARLSEPTGTLTSSERIQMRTLVLGLALGLVILIPLMVAQEAWVDAHPVEKNTGQTQEARGKRDA